MTFPRTEAEILAAAIKRAAQRERDRYVYSGDKAAREVARQMWNDFCVIHR